MNPIDSLNLLDKKIEELVYRMEILKKENFELQNLLKLEKEKNSKFEQELLILRQEKTGFNSVKEEIRLRIENLITKLTGNKTSMLLDEKGNPQNTSLNNTKISSNSISIEMVEEESI